MSSPTLLSEIQDDGRAAPANLVIYLEGQTDPAFFFALLGLSRLSTDIHQGVLVKGLKSGATGSEAVKTRVDLASRSNLAGSADIFGIVDGDGQSLTELQARFDPPYLGPLFHWKAYCIENLVAKTGWPPAWGVEPDWSSVLTRYGPYVALNRLGAEVRAKIGHLNLARHASPTLKTPTWSRTDVKTALSAGKNLILSLDVEAEYEKELSLFDTSIQTDLDEAHALINGKWLIRHLAPCLTSQDVSRCTYDWIAHAISVGGLPEVRDWWQRITGSPP